MTASGARLGDGADVAKRFENQGLVTIVRMLSEIIMPTARDRPGFAALPVRPAFIFGY